VGAKNRAAVRAQDRETLKELYEALESAGAEPIKI